MFRSIGYRIADFFDWLRYTGAGHLVLALAAVVVAVAVTLALTGGNSGSNNTIADEPDPEPPALATPGEAPTPSAIDDTPGGAAVASAYPALATRNTTRVDSTDPVQTAAAVARLSWPDAEGGVRPPAVTLVDVEDWMTAIAAASLTAAPVSAPILYSDADALPPATTHALETLQPTGAGGTDNAQVFTFGTVPSPDKSSGLKVRAGKAVDAAARAAEITDLRVELTGEEPDNIVIASGDDPYYAMPAAAWAARSGDAILFTANGTVPEATVDTILKYQDAKVWVLGPEEAISDAQLAEIQDAAKKGANRIGSEGVTENSITFARFHDRKSNFGWDITLPGHGFVVALADRVADAAAAAPLSGGGSWGPLLLVEPGAAELPASLTEYLLDLKPGYSLQENKPTDAVPNHVWVIGDTATFPVAWQAKLDGLAEPAPVSLENE